ncbi:MAG: STAS domain-containing protein [Candidatus Eremiobacteraeota bacterium]|nr:STAS domain-containing protein [Candidatus Eremiobacteraeota bacterium]
MQPADIQLETDGDVRIVVTAGELDLSVAELLAERIETAASGPVVVSLAACTYADSTILTVLIKATKAHPALVVLLPATHRLRRIFEIANVDAILSVAATHDEALALARRGSK